MTEIKIESLMVFPLKSAKGIHVQQSGFTSTGLDYDREFMIVEVPLSAQLLVTIGLSVITGKESNLSHC